MVDLIVFLTFRCNYSCPYCTWKYRENIDFASFPMYDGRKWLEALLKNFPGPGNTFDFSGGEPSMTKNFIPLLKGISEHNKVSMTTNLSFDPSTLAYVSSNNINSISCSLHPTQVDPVEFFKKVAMVKTYTRNVSINFVMWKKQISKIEEYKKLAADIDVRLTMIPPVLPNLTKKDLEDVDKHVPHDVFLCKFNDVTCSAGREHVNIFPDGSVYSCMMKVKYLGNIFNENVKPLEHDIECHVALQCTTCDSMHVTMREIPSTKDVKK